MESTARYVCVVSVIVHLSLGIPLALTSVGNFRGIVQDFGGHRIEVFAGIAYAKPPLKLHRFRPPETVKRSPLVSRFNPFNVSRYPSACTQLPTTDSSEDCLYLSVWRRQGTVAMNRKSVVVIIHDGGFHKGNAHDEWKGSVLAALGDVIVVGFNYRLGVLGFLDLEVHGAQGFVGLEDQQLALEWIHDHISRFGGDRHNIILMAQEAGATSAIFHINRNPGRFQGAILDSLWLPPDDNRTIFDRALEIAKSLNCSGDKAEEIAYCLRTQSVETLAAVGQFFYPTLNVDVAFKDFPVIVGFAEPGFRAGRNVTLASVCKTLMWAKNATEMGSPVNLYYWRKDSSAALLELLVESTLKSDAAKNASFEHSDLVESSLQLAEMVSNFARNHSVDSFGSNVWTKFNDDENVLVLDGNVAKLEKTVPFLDECKLNQHNE